MNTSQIVLWSLAALAVHSVGSPAARAAAAIATPSDDKSQPKAEALAPETAQVWSGRSPTLALTPDSEIIMSSEKGRIEPLSARVFASPAAIAEPLSTGEVATTPLAAAEAAIAPITTANNLTVVELVEPGTGNAWLPAQSAGVLTESAAELAQLGSARQTTSGWYVSLAPELVFGYDIETDGGEVTVAVPISPAPGLPPVGTTNVSVPLEASIDTDSGFGISGAFGYRFDNARAEIEVGYNSNDVDSITVNDVETSVDGSINTWRFLLNGYYDFPTGSRFRPYVGGGAGLAILSADDVSTTVPTLGVLSIDDSSSSFLFQFKAGVGYDVTDTLNAFLGYRLTGIPGQEFEALGTDLEADTLFIHALQLGARYEF